MTVVTRHDSAPSHEHRPSPVQPCVVAPVLAICNDARIPVTLGGGRSGCVGGTIPLFGGVSLDMCGISGIIEVDGDSLLVDVRAGTFGDHYEHELRTVHGSTLARVPRCRPALESTR